MLMINTGILRSKPSWILPLFYGEANITTSGSDNRVILTEYEIDKLCTLTEIVITHGGTSAGNFICGMYGPVTNADDPTGCPLIAITASTATSGPNTQQTISFTSSVKLGVGKYFLAVQVSSGTTMQLYQTDISYIPDSCKWYYDAAYGAIADPCPALSASTKNLLIPLKVT